MLNKQNRLSPLSALGLFVFAMPGLAVAAEPAPTGLDAISVTAQRGEKAIGDVAGTASVIDAQEREDRGLSRMQDLVRYEPGVEVTNQPARAGAGGYTIRGITDNRIRMQIDGMRLPDFPGTTSGGGARGSSLYTRDMVDFDTLKQVEILRGPASALYGSDALGGVVSYTTKDPQDYLTSGKAWGVNGRAAYDGMDKSRKLTAATAGQEGPFSALLLYSRKDGSEFQSKNSRFRNPADLSGNSVLGKVVWKDGNDRLALTADYFQRATDTNLRSDLGIDPNSSSHNPIAVLSSLANDETKRYRVGLEHRHEMPGSLIDRLEWRLFYTGFERTEHVAQKRSSSRGALDRSTGNRSKQSIAGGEVQGHSNANWLGLAHGLTYGVGLDWIETSRLRDRFERNPVTGQVNRSFIAGPPGAPLDVYPNKTFPDTVSVQSGLYVQDEIVFGSFSLIPAVRFDYYRMTPNEDQPFKNAGNPKGFEVRKIEKLALSPKLGTRYKINETYTLFGQYAHGFRAPPYDDANISFTSPGGYYEVIPNPNLRPEYSDGFEAGLRSRFHNGSSFSLVGFYNLYSDFIEYSNVNAGASRSSTTRFQAQNVTRARIYGLEASGEWRFLPEAGLFGGVAFAHGENSDTGAALDSVAPVTLNAGLRYRALEDRWGGELALLHALVHKRVSDPSYFQAPAYTTLDAMAFYVPLSWLRFSLGLYNLFDERWYRYSDVTGLAKSAADRERYLQSGRTLTAAMTLKW